MKVLITRPRAQANEFAEKLREAGFDPVFFPMIEIQPIEKNAALKLALDNLALYDWVIFTSVNAVIVTLKDCVPAAFGATKVAAVGPKTADALRIHGIEPHFIPLEFIAEAIVSGLGDLRGQRVLLPRAELASPELPAAIQAAGGSPEEIIVYKTLPAQREPDLLTDFMAGRGVITFTSASAVVNFTAFLRHNHLTWDDFSGDLLTACIGPVTARTARDAGCRNVMVAKDYTTDGLIDILPKLENL